MRQLRHRALLLVTLVPVAPLQTQCRYITKRRYDVVTGQMYEYVVRVCF